MMAIEKNTAKKQEVRRISPGITSCEQKQEHISRDATHNYASFQN